MSLATDGLDAAHERHHGDAADFGLLKDYRLVAKIFHWTTAALVALMVSSGVAMTQLGGGPVADFLFGAHKLAGVGVLALVCLRGLYRLTAQIRGRWRAHVKPRRVHYLLYVMIIATPLLGWAGVSDFGARAALFNIVLPAIWPEGAGYADALLSAHAYLAFGLLAIVCIHIGLALQDYIMRQQYR